MSPVINWLCATVRQLQSDIIAIKVRCEDMHSEHIPHRAAPEPFRQVVSIADALGLNTDNSMYAGSCGNPLLKKSVTVAPNQQPHHHRQQEELEDAITDDLLCQRLEEACSACGTEITRLEVNLLYMDLMRVMNLALQDVHAPCKDNTNIIDQSAIDAFIASLQPGFSNVHCQIVDKVRHMKMFSRLFGGCTDLAMKAIATFTSNALAEHWHHRCTLQDPLAQEEFDDLVAQRVYEGAMGASLQQ